MSDRQKDHFVNYWAPNTHSPFQSRQGGGSKITHYRHTQAHGLSLQRQYNQSWQEFESQKQHYRQVHQIEQEEDGILLAFKSSEGLLLTLDRFDLISKGIELRSVKMSGEQQIATVYIPDRSRSHFLKAIEKFTRETKQQGSSLFYLVEEIQSASVEALWTEPFPLPENKDEKFPWEVWLTRDEDENTFEPLFKFCQKNELFYYESPVYLNDRTVILISASIREMEAAIFLVPNLSELRKASSINSDFIEMQRLDAKEFIEDLSDRVEVSQSGVLVSLFDTGIKANHPLIMPFLEEEHIKVIDGSWSSRDNYNHGTLMAGVALYGDLSPTLLDQTPIKVNFELESVKIFNQISPEPQFIPINTQIAFDLTSDDDYQRIYVMSLTQNQTNLGLPTSQSALIDKHTFGTNGKSKLMIVPTGNRQEGLGEIKLDYLDAVDNYQAEEPAQSWNALTVGGYTELTSVSDPNFRGAQILADRGELSANSKVSTLWDQKKWPIKPDIVMESGNYISLNNEINSIDDLSILSTSGRINTLLQSINGTSAASAKAAGVCAHILSKNPDFRAETIKALVVHTAEWTDKMLEKFDLAANKSSKEHLLRTYGYGVPNLTNAMHSATNSVTLIIEDEIVPYAAKEKNQKQQINEWKVHDLPWPTDLLLELGSTEVKVTVTLCYFIEPHASRRGFMSRYKYDSHGLRYKMKAPGESDEDFRVRVNLKESEGESSRTQGDDYQWFFGPRIRSHTTCQKDIWQGSAASLADKNQIGVYPVGGWWKEMGKKEREKGLYGMSTHYSLIVTIETEEEDIDLYSEIKNVIDIESAVRVTQELSV